MWNALNFDNAGVWEPATIDPVVRDLIAPHKFVDHFGGGLMALILDKGGGDWNVALGIAKTVTAWSASELWIVSRSNDGDTITMSRQKR